ncbi:hypothetical protein Tco_0163142 [Tanacetum coccineum]
MMEKMKSPQCVENKIRIAPPDYSKENHLAMFAPHRDLTPEMLFWAKDHNERRKAEASIPKPYSAPTVYPPNTPVKLVPRVLPTKSQVVINIYVLTQLFTEFDKTCKKRITPTGVTDGERGFEQTKRFYLTEVIPFFKNHKQHFEGVQKALFKQVKGMEEIFDQMTAEIMRVHTREKTSTMLNEIESLKAQLKRKVSCVTSDSVKPKVIVPGMYAIDVKPIAHPLKNNRSAHLTMSTILRRLSQELLEYVIGTCPKSFNERDNKAPSTPVTRKKQVTFNDKPGTSSSNTQKHEVHQKVQLTNVPVIHSTGINTSTEASGSKPRSNTKKNRILPAKSENKKKVEDHPRTNKSVWTKVNRVDSSISSKRVVINSNSESVCKTCNKCLNSANHEMCVVNILSSVNATPTVKIVLNKGKQIWKPKGKLSDNSLNKTKRVWKATGKLFADIGYQWRPTGKKFTLGKLICSYQWRPTGKKFAKGELCPLTKLSVKYSIISANQQDPNKNWGTLLVQKIMTGNRFKAQDLYVKASSGTCRFGNDHFGAIMGKFCDSDLEVAFRKTISCFVRDINGLTPSPVPALRTFLQKVTDLEISIPTECILQIFSKGVAAGQTIEDTSITQADLHPSVNPVAGEPSSAQSTSGDVSFEPTPNCTCQSRTKELQNGQWIEDAGGSTSDLDEYGDVLKNYKASVSCTKGNSLGGRRKSLSAQPNGFESRSNPTLVYRLKRALYGLKTGTMAWFDHNIKVPLANNFFKVPWIHRLFTRISG